MRSIAKGISFPFRIGVKGGVVMSSISDTSYLHAVESMQQIVLTKIGERAMRFNYGCDADSEIFAPNDTSSHTLLAHDIKNALNTFYGDYVEVKSVRIFGESNIIYAEVRFSLKPFEGIVSANLKVGSNL